MEGYSNGETANFYRFWNNSFYSLDEWAIENLVCLYDSEYNLIIGEHHETLPDGSKSLIELPDILKGKDAKSKDFLKKLTVDEYPVDYVFSTNKHPVLVYIGEIRYESNETVVGYVVVGTDFVSVINNLIHGKYKYKYNCYFYFYF